MNSLEPFPFFRENSRACERRRYIANSEIFVLRSRCESCQNAAAADAAWSVRGKGQSVQGIRLLLLSEEAKFPTALFISLKFDPVNIKVGDHDV